MEVLVWAMETISLTWNGFTRIIIELGFSTNKSFDLFSPFDRIMPFIKLISNIECNVLSGLISWEYEFMSFAFFTLNIVFFPSLFSFLLYLCVLCVRLLVMHKYKECGFFFFYFALSSHLYISSCCLIVWMNIVCGLLYGVCVCMNMKW